MQKVENQSDTDVKIEIVCDQLRQFLQEKNKRYGDSALNPISVFAKDSNALDKLLVRLDDKVSRIMNSVELRKNDCQDILGYLVLVCIKMNWMDFKDQID